MEQFDSQLSDLIKQGRMQNETQEIEGNGTQELSQNTIQKILDACPESPFMSQNTSDEIMKEIIKTPGMDLVYTELCHREHTENDLKDASFLQLSPHSELYQETSLKKIEKTRTPRILDSPPLSLMNAYEMNASRGFHYDTKDSELLNQSDVSEDTLTQIQCGSQSVDYLRKRTVPEQERRNKNRLAEKILENKLREKQDMVERDFMAGPARGVEPINFDNNTTNNFNNIEEPIEEETWMSVSVNADNAAKYSDLAYEATDNDGKYLWTKRNCKVPIDVKWKVDSGHCHRELFLRIRFVSYAPNTNLDSAIRNPNTNVEKCATHIQGETRNPIDSFFYVINSERNWSCDEATIYRGHSFVTKMCPGSSELSFDIMFMCQKSCMGLQQKRKIQCFAVFLEDENGNEIINDRIDKVAVVAYPRRDWKAFCEKRSDFTFSENTSIRQPPSNTITSPVNRQQLPPGTHSPNQAPANVMLSVTNTPKMYTSKSATRKRAASEITPVINAKAQQSTSASYVIRISGCDTRMEAMDIDHGMVENDASTSKKRFRLMHYPRKNITLSDKEYSKVVTFLAENAKDELSKLTLSQRFGRFSSSMNSIMPSDGIDKFLALLGEQREVDRFRNQGIHKMSDLVEAFEKGRESRDTFENLGVHISKLEKYYDVFLHYYRIQENDKLCNHDEMM